MEQPQKEGYIRLQSLNTDSTKKKKEKKFNEENLKHRVWLQMWMYMWCICMIYIYTIYVYVYTWGMGEILNVVILELMFLPKAIVCQQRAQCPCQVWNTFVWTVDQRRLGDTPPPRAAPKAVRALFDSGCPPDLMVRPIAGRHHRLWL